MTNQEKKEYLLGYQRINQRVNCLLLEQQRWRELATRVSPNLSGMPRGGGGGGTQGAVAKIVDLETEINEEKDRGSYPQNKRSNFANPPGVSLHQRQKVGGDCIDDGI